MNDSSKTAVPVVDVNIPRFNQAVVALVTGIAFVARWPWLVACAAVILGLSAFTRLAPLTRLYVELIRPRFQPSGPDEFEPAAPPRFSQRLGAVVLGVASILLFAGVSSVGWALTVLVTALATLAATARICVGCLFYERVVAR